MKDLLDGYYFKLGLCKDKHCREEVKVIKEFAKDCYERGRQSVLDEWAEEQKKFLQGFSYKKKK